MKGTGKGKGEEREEEEGIERVLDEFYGVLVLSTHLFLTVRMEGMNGLNIDC